MSASPESPMPSSSFVLQIRDQRWDRPEFDWHEMVQSVLPLAFDVAVKARGNASEERGEVCLVFTSDAEVAVLNSQWRGKDGPTNVLSFPAGDDEEFNEDCEEIGDVMDADGDADRVLGDVILAFETIAREAEEQGKAFRNHTAHLLVHGVLHLLGYDHQTDEEAEQMEAIESQVLASAGIADPWHSHQADVSGED